MSYGPEQVKGFSKGGIAQGAQALRGNEEIRVDLMADTLPLSGEKKKEEKVERKDYHRLERSYGFFRRSFTLPGEVQSDKAAAKFKDGILEVRVPKREEAKKKEKRVIIE